MNKFVITFVVALVLVLVSCQHLTSEPEEDFYGFLEKDCLQKGGLCIVKPECAQIIESPTELCPEQGKDGFQCCFGLAIHDQRCRMHGGECSLEKDCNPTLIYRNASDCEKEFVCCLLE